MTQSNKPSMPNLPGFEAMADTLEFVKNMWGGMQSTAGIPGIPGITMPTMSVEEINKQIADLKAVESWLNLNMNMLRGTIQALEVQSATIASLNAMGAAFGAEMKPNSAASNAPYTGKNTADWTSAENPFAPKKDVPVADNNPLHTQAAVDVTKIASDATDATTAWWAALQAQFNQAVNSVMADESLAKKAATEKPSAKTSSTKTEKSAATSSAGAMRNKTSTAAKKTAKAPVKKRAPSAKS